MRFTVMFLYPPGDESRDADRIYTTVVDVSEFIDPDDRVSFAIRTALREMGAANDRQGDSLVDLAQEYELLAVFEGDHDNLVPPDDGWLNDPDELIADVEPE